MTSDRPLTVLGISGSLRKASFNSGLLRAAQETASSCQNLWKFPSKANGRSVCRSRHLVHVATL